MKFVIILVYGIATINTAQSQSPAVCPGELVTYDCSSITAHTWRGTAFNGQCDDNGIGIIVADTEGETFNCGVFTATITTIDGTTNEISSELTFTASVDLDGLTVECALGDFSTTIQIKIPGPPVFPDSVEQDRAQDSEDRTTVITWQPAAVSQGGVTYGSSDMTADGVTVTIADNSQTTAVVTVPEFNVPYRVCIEAFDECGNPSGTPRCTTVIIEAEAVVIADLSIGLVCCMVQAKGEKLLAQGANVVWTVDDSRNGDILRPPVTMANLTCEQDRAQGLLPSDNEFMFSSASHRECFSSSQADFSLELVNEAGPATKMESANLSVIEFPATFSRDSPSVFTLNAMCSENPTDFSIRIMYRPLFSQGEFTAAEGQYDGSVDGFPVTLEGLSDNVMGIEYELTLFCRGNSIGSVSNRIEIQDVLVPFAVTVPILSVIVGVLVIALVTTNIIWYCRYRTVISRTATLTSDVELQAQNTPVYEDVSELPQPTGCEISTEQNQAYGPVKSS